MRVKDWETRLDYYIGTIRDFPFEWGFNDCLCLADGAINAQTGSYLFQDWRGTYTNEWGCLLNYKKKLKKVGCSDIVEAVDKRLDRLNLAIPRRGSLVGRRDHLGASVMSIAFGIVVSDKAAFLGYDGLVFLPVQDNDIFWNV